MFFPNFCIIPDSAQFKNIRAQVAHRITADHINAVAGSLADRSLQVENDLAGGFASVVKCSDNPPIGKNVFFLAADDHPDFIPLAYR